ncbi:CKLF-like MARVEL transmembrane domain-containing protein 4 isoform X2 [Ostrea edulis]|uniref:CKLF-like MARVEL transmembrane domain-containing protein 4 isoform X2 n=1 Tax=Ostrea edulis TaxID=37623 RepID=UPI0024AF5B61|nr:CKLF-like MARVEL transmembrane domain-containing protein 4 isoform X2 [Ostrea edulis]
MTRFSHFACVAGDCHEFPIQLKTTHRRLLPHMSSTEENAPNSQETDRQTIPIGSTSFSINVTFARSFLGIFEAVIILLSLISLICAGAGANLACDYNYGSNYGFYEFVAGSVFITYLIDYVIFIISIDEKLCLKLVPFLFWHFVVGAMFTLLYLIASIVMAAHICGQGGYAAATVFGFISTVVMGIHTYFCLLSLRHDHAPTDNKVLNMLGVPQENSASSQSPQYDPENLGESSKY